jgi:hypothetical protein
LIKDLEGLGLASSTLSFFGAEAQPSPVPAPPTTTTNTAPDSSSPQPKPEDAVFWHVAYREPDGGRVIKRLTTAQLRVLIEQPDFDLGARAARDGKQPKQALATYPEFEQALKVHVAKASRYQSLYEQIECEQQSQERWERVTMSWRRAVAQAGPLVRLAALAGALFVVRMLFNRWTG